MRETPTIAAISTPLSVGAIGLVRLSGPEAVAIAYDKTVLKCHELKWPYCNGILKKWHQAGLHTAEEIREGDRPGGKTPEASQRQPGHELRKYMQELHRDRR